MTQTRHKMSLCCAYRSFAIYLVIVSLISESPASAFTIRRTTTLRPLETSPLESTPPESTPPDLAGAASALLAVKSELTQLNNVNDHRKIGRDKLTLRKSVNFLTPDKKLTPTTDLTFNPLNKDERTPSDEKSTRHPETTTEIEGKKAAFAKKYRILSTRRNKEGIKFLPPGLSSLNLKRENNISSKTDEDTAKKTTETTSTEDVGSTTFVTDETKTTGDETTTTEIPSDETSTTIVNDNEKETTEEEESSSSVSSTTEAESTSVSESSGTTGSTETTGSTGTTETTGSSGATRSSGATGSSEATRSLGATGSSGATGSTGTTEYTGTTPVEPSRSTQGSTGTSESTGAETTVTDITDHKETMEGQSSEFSTKNPSWKKYTVIERRRLMSTTELASTSTEELDNAESVSSTVTVNNAISKPQAQDQSDTTIADTTISDTTITNKDKEDDTDSTTLETSKVLTTEEDQTPTTQNIETDTTTQHYIGSKRAGYLDFSMKQNTSADELVTEHLEDVTMYNETELLGSMFEMETQEDEPDMKNSTIIESQSQLADDAIKEELLKERFINDHHDNSKRIEDQQDLNRVKPLEANDSTDDSLSVKPINQGKGALYTVSSNYKKMKKIEVQPSKPFVRDPDDNSWRNESLTSLGIVFKAKNASKPFTEVLRNKTEAELNGLIQSERDNNNEVPDLRQRLEKIAEVRKSRKKKIDKYGETIYSDYEEASGETSSTPRTDTVSMPVLQEAGELFFVPSSTTSPQTQATLRTTSDVYMYKEEVKTTIKPKKHKFQEYYDTTDEYDADYLSLAKIDLKKFTTKLFKNDENAATTVTVPTAPPVLTPYTKSVLLPPQPDRKPTLQYFPPREPPQKVSINDYDSDFQKRVNMYAQGKPMREPTPRAYVTPPPATIIREKPIQYKKKNTIPLHPAYKTGQLDKNVYVTFPLHAAEQDNRYPGSDDESFNRASYVIKHYKDLINEAVKDDYDKSVEFTYTEAPLIGVTMTKEKSQMKNSDEDYDYDTNFRKDLINRFVDNFNQNSERFKVDFPILYNNTVVHMKAQENGKVVASSSAFMKRLYGDGPGRTAHKPCDPHCEMKVELSPAYELHYYVPEQEEKEEADLKPATLPFAYRL